MERKQSNSDPKMMLNRMDDDGTQVIPASENAPEEDNMPERDNARGTVDDILNHRREDSLNSPTIANNHRVSSSAVEMKGQQSSLMKS